jgi:hypothetical protein
MAGASHSYSNAIELDRNVVGNRQPVCSEAFEMAGDSL